MQHDRSRQPHSQTATKAERDGSKAKSEAEWKEALSPGQYHVLRDKGTDPPGRGKYDEFFKDGRYDCAACGTPLYSSGHKFACGCGWPGYWSCLPKAVREEPDSDGRRVEIVCNACDGHLGHVFRGERFGNPVNERHCVNSTSVTFVEGTPLPTMPEK